MVKSDGGAKTPKKLEMLMEQNLIMQVALLKIKLTTIQPEVFTLAKLALTEAFGEAPKRK